MTGKKFTCYTIYLRYGQSLQDVTFHLMRYCIYFSLFLMIGCSNTDEGIKQLKKKYSKKDFNAFYERTFTLDTTQGPPLLFKWEDDIQYFITGDSCAGNLKVVAEVINQYRELELPIRFIETKEENKANLVISFGANLRRTSAYAPGRFYISGELDRWKKAIIEIRNEENFYAESKQFILMHEFGHVLGIPHHVLSTTQSVFHANSNYAKLNEQDKISLKMLYEPYWPKMYHLSDFEKDFFDDLYHLNVSKKHYEPHQRSALDSILKYSVVDDSTYKHPNIIKFTTPAKVIVSGDLNAQYIEVINSTVAEINASSNIKLECVLSEIKSELGAINIHFTHDPTMVGDTIISARENKIGRSGHFGVSRCWNIYFRFKENYEKNKAIISYLIFDCICFLPSESYFSSITITNNKVKFNPVLKDMIHLLYSEEFPNSISKYELRKLRRHNT